MRNYIELGIAMLAILALVLVYNKAGVDDLKPCITGKYDKTNVDSIRQLPLFVVITKILE
jgi:hypothetical protein